MGADVNIDGEWSTHGAEIQKPGAFSALGGLYSTVADLAIWVAGFLDAWPARDESDAHPLCRASRREMQQVHTAQPVPCPADICYAQLGLRILRIVLEFRIY